MKLHQAALLISLSCSRQAYSFVLSPSVGINKSFVHQRRYGRVCSYASALESTISSSQDGDETSVAVEDEESPITDAYLPVDNDDVVVSPEESKLQDAEKVASEEDVKIYIGNLAFGLDNARVRDLFEPFGAVKDVFLPINRATGDIRGFGFVSMPNKDEADAAINALNESEVEGRTVYVNEASQKRERRPSRPPTRIKLYVGNISFYTEPDDLTAFFEQYGPVYDTYIPTDRDSGRPRGFAFVTMDPKDAEVAIENADGQQFDGRTLKVNKSLPKGEKRRRSETARYEPSGTRLYVGNLSYESDEESIRSLFEEYGTVKECIMPMDRYSGRGRGFAFVTMEPEDAETALETDGYELDGRIIRVDKAQPKTQRGGYGNDSLAVDDGYDGDSWDAESSAGTGEMESY